MPDVSVPALDVPTPSIQMPSLRSILDIDFSKEFSFNIADFFDWDWNKFGRLNMDYKNKVMQDAMEADSRYVEEQLRAFNESIVQPVVDTTISVADAIADTVQPAIQPVVDTVGAVVDPIVDTTVDAAEAVSSVVEPVVSGVVDVVVDATAPLADIIAETTKPVVEAASKVVEPIYQIVDPVIKILGDEAKEFINDSVVSAKPIDGGINMQVAGGFVDVSKYLESKWNKLTEGISVDSPFKDVPIADIASAISNPQAFADNMLKKGGETFLKNIGIGGDLIQPIMDVIGGKSVEDVAKNFAVNYAMSAMGINPMVGVMLSILGAVAGPVYGAVQTLNNWDKFMVKEKLPKWIENFSTELINDPDSNSVYTRLVEKVSNGGNISFWDKLLGSIAVQDKLIDDFGYRSMKNLATPDPRFPNRDDDWRDIWNDRAAMITDISMAFVDHMVTVAKNDAAQRKYNNYVASVDAMKNNNATEDQLRLLYGNSVDVNKAMDYQSTMKKVQEYRPPEPEPIQQVVAAPEEPYQHWLSAFSRW
jgi:hypothetical protein